MKLYLNNDVTGIEIEQFSHDFHFMPDYSEGYNILLANTENIETLATTFGNVPITNITLKKGDTVVKTLANVDVKINTLNEIISENSTSVTMSISQILDNQ